MTHDLPPEHAMVRPISGNTNVGGTGDEWRFLLDSDGHIQVDVLSMPTVTETNSAAIKSALEIMDDWDESDYCKTILYGHDGSQYRRAKINSSGELSVYTP